MLTTRQEKVLEIIIREYVKNVTPVGSKLICDELNCSSATVRNEMAALENAGFLEKTHISSGRVPSEEGYRYYVDNLMKPREMTGEDMLKLQTIFNNNKLALNEVLKKSLEIISEITDYTSVVLGNSVTDNKLQKVEVLPISETKLIAIIITDKGHVEHKEMKVEGVSLDEITKTVELINKLIIGTPIHEIKEKLEFEIKPIINQYVSQHEALYNAFYDVFNDFAMKSDKTFVGRTKILNQPEFNNVEKIKKIFNKLDDENLLQSIEEDDKDINIYIGNESNLDEDVTIIKTKYKTDNDEGTIAIIGPKRMEYSKVVTLLGYIKDNLNKK
ncbi:MAG: heat-inducible transcription repressor HrcA [Bacilli bacterium]|nr:heat-inducible transcription repressor HrcA [Bacilli bacterium]